MSSLRSRSPLLLVALLATPLLLLGWHPLRSKVAAVEEGNEALAAGDAKAALEAYEQAVSEVPENLALHYDRGLALLAADRLDEAVEALGRARHSPDPDLRYRASFALGSLRYRQEDWEGAVEAYKTALKLRPRDDDVRLNYELAWLKLHPPCRLKEDALEENDTPETASLLTAPPQEPLRACPGDDDWFALDVPAGASLFASLKVLGEQAPLVLSLFDPSGEQLQLAKGDKELGVELRLAPVAGRYRLRAALDGPGDAQPAYELGIDLLAPCPLGEDGLEENDLPEQAREVAKGEQKGLRICPGDEDWFAVPLKEGEKLAAVLTFSAARGPLEVELQGEDGLVLAHGQGGGGQAVAALAQPVDAAQRVLVRVKGQLEGTDNRYDMKLSDEPPDKDDQKQGQDQDDKEQQEQKKEQEQEKKEQEQDEKEQEQEQQEKEQEQEQEQPQPEPVPLDRQAMDRALDALRNEDRNVQLEKLLRGLPEQQVPKDW